MPTILNSNVQPINSVDYTHGNSGTPTLLPVSRVSNTSTAMGKMVVEHSGLVKFGLFSLGVIQAKSLFDSIYNGDITHGVRTLCSAAATYMAYKGVNALAEQHALLEERDIEIRLHSLKQDAMIENKFEQVFGHAPSSPIDCFEEPAPLTEQQVSDILYGGSDQADRLKFAVAQATATLGLSEDECLSIRKLIKPLCFGLIPNERKKEIFNAGGNPGLTLSMLHSLSINEREKDALTNAALEVLEVPDHLLFSLTDEEIEARLKALVS
ncbi:MAG: hypothetical protein ACRCXB_35285 [Aeromonadaceae bacterium]